MRGAGLTTKGHPLVWHEVWPDWAPKAADDSIPLLRDRVRDIITRYRGTIRYWDILNEANNAPEYAARSGEGAWIVRDGAADVVATALGWAREAVRGVAVTNMLLYNDFNTGEPNLALLAALQKRNALPDAIGIQSHMHGGVWPLEDVWATAERFSRFGKPIHFTEVTVLGGRAEPGAKGKWRDSPEDEARQADYTAAFYRLLFSHPSVQAITWWDFSDRGAWKNAPAGFLRADMTPKPVYDRLMALIRGEWWTRLDGRTDGAGTFTARVFGGEHDVTVTDAKGRAVTRHIAVPPGEERRLTMAIPE